MALLPFAVEASEGFSPSQDTRPINLGEDEIYRRDGSLVDLNTCLAVADDGRLAGLLDHPQLVEVLKLPPVAQAEALRRMPRMTEADGELTSVHFEKVQLRPGFGTLLACSQIVAAWYSKTLMTDGRALFPATAPVRSTDGRVEYGTLVIDLSIGKDLRAFIEPVPLARILTSPGMVPPSAYGGIVVKNAIVNKTLKLHNIRLTKPVAFINVKFAGRSVSQKLFDIDRRSAVTALAITSAYFEDHVVFADSEFCGDVTIEESRFDETLAFRAVDQFTIGCRRQPDADSGIGLRIVDSRFAQSLSFIRSRFAAATISGVSVDNLAADRVDFGRKLDVEESDLGSLTIDCSILAIDATIARNQIAKALNVVGTDRRKDRDDIDTTCGDWWQASGWQRPEPFTDLRVADNRIGGGFNLRHFTGQALKSPLRLPSNRVGGRSQVIMPGPKEDGSVWEGQVTFQGSTYDGTLEIRRSRWQENGTAPRAAEIGYCSAVGSDGQPFEGMSIQLRAMRVRTLQWNMPLDCDHRWLGYGLTYDLWITGDYALTSLGSTVVDDYVTNDHRALKVWRKTLKRYDSPSLSAMSRYMAQNGHYVDSRRVLLEAKRLNYAPTCQPDQWAGRCAVSVGSRHLYPAIARVFKTVDKANAADEDAVTDPESPLWTTLQSTAYWAWRLVMLVLLWPGGYGAEPERALVLLVAFFGVCWIVYAVYVRGMRRKLLDDWASIKLFVDAEERRRARRSDAPAVAQQTDEDPGTFKPHPAVAEQTAGEEASPEAMSNPLAMSDRERLGEMQGPLLSKIKVWERNAAGGDLKTLVDYRERIEDFGNTDIPGFGRFDTNKMPTRFTESRYAFDTMLPVIDLHAYSAYYPTSDFIRAVSMVQHVFGWWWVTVFIASAAIL